ncbi:MAG: uncharacterized protein A8A55_1542 [Amphiamblys sp. WSBS2006]|nr:MAG: uncharacterized protein A8A55_1542 [Amphiamblys sp. WSBS2006]
MEIELGERVWVKGHIYETQEGRAGVLRFYGPTQFRSGVWAGVELDEKRGRNDGTVDGVRYFACGNRHGVFVHPARIEPLGERAPAQMLGLPRRKNRAIRRLEENIDGMHREHIAEMDAARKNFEEALQKQKKALERKTKTLGDAADRLRETEILVECLTKEQEEISQAYLEYIDTAEKRQRGMKAELGEEVDRLTTEKERLARENKTLAETQDTLVEEIARLQGVVGSLEKTSEQTLAITHSGNKILQERLKRTEAKYKNTETHRKELLEERRLLVETNKSLSERLERISRPLDVEEENKKIKDQLKTLQAQYCELDTAYGKQKNYFSNLLQNKPVRKEKMKKTLYVPARQKEIIRGLFGQISEMRRELEAIKTERLSKNPRRSAAEEELGNKIERILNSNILDQPGHVEDVVLSEFQKLNGDIDLIAFTQKLQDSPLSDRARAFQDKKTFSFQITP